jgi:hypothetical protein
VKIYQLRMLPEHIITDADSYQQTWDLAAEPSSLHATRRDAKRAAAKRLATFVDYVGGDDDRATAKIDWDGDAGTFESVTGTVTFVIHHTTVR